MGKIVEVDEDELLKSQKLRDTVARIMKNPKAAAMIEQAHKLVDPAAPTPHLDAQQPVEDRFSTQATELAELRKQIAEDKQARETKDRLDALNNQVESGIAKLRAAGWTEEGIKGVRELMEQKGILDPEIGAAYFEKLHPPQSPVTPIANSSSWNLFEAQGESDGDLQKLISSRGDSESTLNKLVSDTLKDLRGQPRR